MIAKCPSCKKQTKIHAKGLCMNCYNRKKRRLWLLKPENKKKEQEYQKTYYENKKLEQK